MNENPKLTQLEAVIIDSAQQALDGMIAILNRQRADQERHQVMELTARHAVIASFAVIANTPDNGMTSTAQSLIAAIHDRCLVVMQQASEE